MKKHESRELKDGENYYVNESGILISNGNESYVGRVYVDSKNLLHSLEHGAVIYVYELYFIHGIRYNEKRDWELKMLEEINN